MTILTMIIRKTRSAVSCYFPRRSTCVRDPLERDRLVVIARIKILDVIRNCRIVETIMDVTSLQLIPEFGKIFDRDDINARVH